MRIAASSVLLLFTKHVSPESFLEPTVKRKTGVLPASVCKELIELGEKAGFTTNRESIDDEETENKVISQSIDVFERFNGIENLAIWRVLEPWIPQLTELISESIDREADKIYFPEKPNRVPQLGWVFFRKYSPDAARKSLKLHTDSNMHTLNIALNDDYVGGGFMYVKPPEECEVAEDDRCDIPSDYISYEWLHSKKRENTSEVVFPELEPGDVIIYNFTLWHGVAPIEKGSRYSISLFYDMDNPAIQADFDDDPMDGLDVVFYHEIVDVEIDLAYVEDDGEGMVDIVVPKMPPFQEEWINTEEGHVFQALISGTDEVISQFVIRNNQWQYMVEMGVDSCIEGLL